MRTTLFLIILCSLFFVAFISTLTISMFAIHRLTPKSVIFERFNQDLSILNNKVKKLCIVHSRLPLPLVNFFSEGFGSHWALGVIDTYNNLYYVSITGFKSVIIQRIKKSTIKLLDNKHISAIGLNNTQFIINRNEIYEAKDNITINDVVNECVKMANIKYELTNHNCQYQTVMSIKPLIQNMQQLPLLITKTKLMKTVINETFSKQCLKLPSKNKRKTINQQFKNNKLINELF